ncbi:MAG: zinc ribbon domain-containing protein [Solirubrobacteraceae bacterium]
MTELLIQRCERCRAAFFPDRLWCLRCRETTFSREPAGNGRVEEETTLRRVPDPEAGEVRLGSVRLAAGPVVIVRLSAGIGAGAEVRLEHASDGAVWARAPHACAVHPTYDRA